MTTYTVEQPTTAVILGTYEAQNGSDALDMYAQDAGYLDYQDLLSKTGTEDDLSVIEED